MSTHDKPPRRTSEDGETEANAESEEMKPQESPKANAIDYSTSFREISGVWAALSSPDESSVTTFSHVEGLLGGIPPKFAGLATAAMNPMAMALSHEEVVVGCADGTI